MLCCSSIPILTGYILGSLCSAGHLVSRGLGYYQATGFLRQVPPGSQGNDHLKEIVPDGIVDEINSLHR